MAAGSHCSRIQESLRNLRDLEYYGIHGSASAGSSSAEELHSSRALQEVPNFQKPATPTFAIFSALHDTILGEVICPYQTPNLSCDFQIPPLRSPGCPTNLIHRNKHLTLSGNSQPVASLAKTPGLTQTIGNARPIFIDLVAVRRDLQGCRVPVQLPVREEPEC